MAKLIITLDKSSERVLEDRAEGLKSHGSPIRLSQLEQAVHFLRGVKSLATMALPAFYLFHGASASDDHACDIEGYPGVVLTQAIKFSSVGTISLSCRKAFDHGPKGLTGANFAKNSDETLDQVAEYWSTKSGRSLQEARAALHLLRSIFRDCSKTDSHLLTAETLLGRRIGLLKQHADRSVAHLTLESYEFSNLDCAHVVAVFTVIGEVIRSFDDPTAQPAYFDSLDEASFASARRLFPAMPDIRLFQDMKIEMQSRLCWQWGIDRGRDMLIEQLPYAIGRF